MLKKTITYTDLDGGEFTEDFYFHMSKADIAEYMLGKSDDFDAYVRDILASENRPELISLFKTLIAASVGKRSEDGRRFIKTPEYRDDFMQTDAYSEFFVGLFQDSQEAARFVNGVMPAGVMEEAARIEAEKKVELPTEFTDAELLAMPQDEFEKVVGTDPSKMTKDQLTLAFRRKNAA